MAKYRIMQDGLTVAQTEAVDDFRALAEAMRYAEMYNQDGFVRVERGSGSRWVLVAERCRREAPE